MASVALTELSDQMLGQNSFISMGMAALDSADQKIHAVSKVIFNESFTEAQVSYTEVLIQYGWPNVLTGPDSPVDPSRITPGYHSTWTQIDHLLPSEYNAVMQDYLKRCCASVEKATVIFDSKKTHNNTLFKKTIINACEHAFPNLKSYSLVFPSA